MTCHLRKNLLCFVISVISSSAFATISISVPTGVSNSVQASGSAAPSWYFSNISATHDPTNTYFLPSGGGACSTNINPQCVTSATHLSFTASSGLAVSGSPAMSVVYNGTLGVPTSGALISSFTSVIPSQAYVNAGDVRTFTASWTAICTAILTNAGHPLGLDGNCQNTTAPYTPITVQVYLIADAVGDGNYTTGQDDILTVNLVFDSSIQIAAVTGTSGLYDFIAFPGDSKVHLKNVQADVGFPAQENSVGVQQVRFYYTTGPAQISQSTFNTLNPANSLSILNFQTTAAADGTLGSYFITGLTNNVTYYFRAALVDMAGNIGFLTINDGPTHIVTPDQVVGLLSKNGNCFIATAAFGSPIAKQVQILRKFRDVILMKSPAGRVFVNWYYAHAPYYAEKLSRHDSARTVVRFFLYPLIGFSLLALKWGAYNASLAFTTLLLFPLLVFFWRRSVKQFKESA